MIRKINTLFVCAMLFFGAIKAQDLERSLLSAAGSQVEAGGIEMAWTLGETAVASFMIDGLDYCLGFQQGIDLIVSTVEPDTWQQVYLYPNPTQAFITVELVEALHVEASLYNYLGQQVYFFRSATTITSLQLPMSQLPAGMYVLRLQNRETDDIKTFKIQKN